MLTTGIIAVAVIAAVGVQGHGLIVSPPSRQAHCGLNIKPDTAPAGSVCYQAFYAAGLDPSQAYNFMSVLTHTEGYLKNGSRSNVCGYNSEFFGNGPTWIDQPVNWPTTNITSGTNVFTWNIQWGPHFSDTSDFRYWITKSDFKYTVGKNLSFTDFDTSPFCNLTYNYATYASNTAVVTNEANSTFKTTCTVPARTGRHVLYVEWGRTPPTYERFHGCVDVCFSGDCSNPATTTAATTATAATATGTATVTTSASATTTSAAACSAKYGQCGGIGWTGSTCCTSSTCTVVNNYYSQCL